MDIQQITDRIVYEASAIYKTAKKGAIWAGHFVQEGFMNHLVPALKKTWSSANANFNTLFSQIKTGPGVIFAIAGGLFIAGVVSFKISDHKVYENDLLSKTSWKALGILNFAAATVATSLAMAAMMT